MELYYYPEVVQSVPGPDKLVYAYFTDGSIHCFDMKPLIKTGGVFSVLNDEEFFRNNITVMNGTLAWRTTEYRDETQCIDIDPFVLYESEQVSDPLEK